jgi:hypothetical protein
MDIAIVHDWGLLVSVALLAAVVAPLVYEAHTRRKRVPAASDDAEPDAPKLDGVQLREGRVIVAVTRTGVRELRTVDGRSLRIDDAPLSLTLGEQGEVLGTFVRDELLEEGGYRKPGRRSVGRLLPEGGRYEVVTPTSQRPSEVNAVALFLAKYFAALTALAGFVWTMDAGDGRFWLSLVWLVGTALPFTLVGFVVLTSIQPEAEREHAVGRKRE